MKVTILGGAGIVGSSTAYRIAQDGKASEIILLDSRPNLAQAHAIDIEQAVAGRSSTTIRVGDIDDSKNSDFIVISVGFPQQFSVTSRSEFLSAHLPLVNDLVKKMIAKSPSAIWFIATSPVDPLVYMIHDAYSIPRDKILGLNHNDSRRFCWAIARTLKVPSTVVEAFVLGEHGETQVPIFSRIRVGGENVCLNSDQTNQVLTEISNFYRNYKKLQSGRTAGWTSAESIGDVFAGIAQNDPKILMASTPVQGEYGLSQVSLGMPLRFDRSGISEIVEFELTPTESNALKVSAQKIKNEVEEGRRYFLD